MPTWMFARGIVVLPRRMSVEPLVVTVTADWLPPETRTVTPESPTSIPCAAAPETPAPRMTVPATVAVPEGDVGEEESWHETVRESAASAPNAKAIDLETVG